jgi:hypothetical protein
MIRRAPLHRDDESFLAGIAAQEIMSGAVDRGELHE